MKSSVAFVGGGISGLAAALELKRSRPQGRITVLESELSAGGKVRTSSEEGYRYDWGPNGFQPAPVTMELVRRLGLEQRLAGASPVARRRYLYRAGALRPVPAKPQQFLASELLSPAGKLRAALEPLLAGRHGGEETVHDFVARHFGFEAARHLAAPMVLGVSAGDAKRLSLDALFPAMRRLESEHGSLLRAMAASGKRSRGGGQRPQEAPLYSFRDGGMGVLTSALAQELGETVRTGCRVVGLEPLEEGGYRLRLGRGEAIETEQVVLATPAFVSASLLRPFLPAVAGLLDQIDYPPLDVFALGYHRVDVPHPLDGFGFLVPRDEGIRSLGVLWPSSLFPDVAPAQHVLLRVIAGGGVDRSFCSLDDAAALAQVRRDLRSTLGITAPPRLVRRTSFEQAIPQYLLGHRALVERAMSECSARGDLVLAGNAYFGVGVNDCIADARRVVNELLAGAGETGNEA